ncbi:alpha/beta hydrolase [Caballeronia mineralivorans PML1(12)]|uniref:Alpha/beta hydrolase n=1 Tax=Caballeronia mineralivorans PML1(12) TaxID=908627 RepID=A0A0J1G4U1_9BURK|nr:alpha/beta hydrolase [Caballeronia mineralivorans]KLU27208.1 alpha/beta hydrolase [Caballeronia mineralivorans PML1(12)]
MRVLTLSGHNAMLRFHDLPGSGTPLVFIHGLGCASSCDYPQVIADSALTGRRGILVDLLGSGYSDRPERFGYRVEDHARIVVELIQGLEREVDLFGHSMGGAVAIVAATMAPREVRRLVLAEPNLDAGGGLFSRKIAAYSESDYVLYGHAQMVATASKEGDPGWAATLAISCPRAIHRAATSLVQGVSLPWRQLLFGLKMPRSVIFGEHSLPHPDALSLPRAGIAVDIVHKAGHFMMRDNPAGLASAINAALSGDSSSDA